MSDKIIWVAFVRNMNPLDALQTNYGPKPPRASAGSAAATAVMPNVAIFVRTKAALFIVHSLLILRT